MNTFWQTQGNMVADWTNQTNMGEVQQNRKIYVHPMENENSKLMKRLKEQV